MKVFNIPEDAVGYSAAEIGVLNKSAETMETIRQLRASGMSLNEAIRELARRELRHQIDSASSIEDLKQVLHYIASRL